MWIDDKGSTVLGGVECKRLLTLRAKERGVGRLGIATDQAPVVVPVNFTFRDGRILARVGAGPVSSTADGHLVAFEIDEIDEVDEVDTRAGIAWSVLVRGLATLIESPTEAELAAAAIPLVPEPGDMVLMIRPDTVTGRRFELKRTR